MKARVIIEYPVPDGQDRITIREREEQRWMTSETVLGLRSATVRVELIEGPNAPAPTT